MSYRYPYNGPSFPQDSMSPTTPGGGSNASTPVNNPWDFEYDVATSTPNQVQQQQDPTTSTGTTTLHPADFSSPQEQFSASATPAAISSPTVIQLEERFPVVPSQYHRSRLNTPSGESRPRTHVQKDTSSAGAEQSTCTNAGSAPSSGLVRVSLTKAHAERTRAHPYRRPHSADGGRAATHVSNAEAGKTSRSVSDHSRVSPPDGNRSGLTRMRYAPPKLPLLLLVFVHLLDSNARAGPAVHRKPCRSIDRHALPKSIQFVPIFISTSTRTPWSPCSNYRVLRMAKSA